MKQISIEPPTMKKLRFVLNEEKGHYTGTERDLSELGVSIPLETQRQFWKALHLSCQNFGDLRKYVHAVNTITVTSVLVMMGSMVLVILGLMPIWGGGYSIAMLVVGLVLFILTLSGFFVFSKWYRAKYGGPLFETYSKVIKDTVSQFYKDYLLNGLIYTAWGKGFRCIEFASTKIELSSRRPEVIIDLTKPMRPENKVEIPKAPIKEKNTDREVEDIRVEVRRPSININQP